MIRWFVGTFVVVGCGYLGISYAGVAEIRIRQLEMLEQMLCQLEFNIAFLLQPFSRALQSVAGSYQGAMSRLFSLVADRMIHTPNLSLEAAFQSALEETSGVRLKQEEREILQEFFRYIGCGDRENSRDGIRMTVAKLRLVRESAISVREKDGKLWRSMGFLGGLLIVLLLV